MTKNGLPRRLAQTGAIKTTNLIGAEVLISVKKKFAITSSSSNSKKSLEIPNNH
jgi:hypothetical protein